MKRINILIMLAIVVTTGTAAAETLDIIVSFDGRVTSQGALGQELHTDEETIVTLMSGGSNISDGLFEFDLSGLPDGTVVTSASLLFRTANAISNTSDQALVDFIGFVGDGTLSLSDQTTSGTTMANQIFELPINNNTEVTVELTNVAPINDALSDGDSNDFLTVRSETINFVNFSVDSLESSDEDSIPATLQLTIESMVFLGDVNQDCNVNLLDVAPFVDLLQNGMFQIEADVNEDGSVDLLDIAPFVDLLAG